MKMSPYVEPRAMLLMPKGEQLSTFISLLGGIGIQGYRTDDLKWVPGVATRVDTLLVVIDARDYALSAVRDTLGSIRAQESVAHEVLIVVLTDSLDPQESETLLAVGADLVERPPITAAVFYRMIGRLVRRSRITAGAEGLTLEDAAQTPHETLRRLVAKHQGRLKIYIGAAPGVGKTYAMLSQAHELVGAGQDVVIGLVETHGRRETLALVDGLEVVPRREISYKGTALTEMDEDAILERHPAWVLVDELAHTNVPGSLNAKRYEDVLSLRLSGINVVSTLNIQHLESLNNIVERITGVRVRETVPDSVLEDATEVVLVDLSPEGLQQRLTEGKIYAQEKITQSLSNFFTTHNLTALRELVLRELADRVDERLEAVRMEIGKAETPTGIMDRILVGLTPTLAAQRLIRRGARLADRLSADFIILYIEDRDLSGADAKRLEQNIQLAESFDAEIVKLRSDDPAGAIARFATDNQITMILLGETRRSRLTSLIKKPVLDRILQETRNIDVVVVATHE